MNILEAKVTIRAAIIACIRGLITEAELFEIVNECRQQRGLKPLAVPAPLPGISPVGAALRGISPGRADA